MRSDASVSGRIIHAPMATQLRKGNVSDPPCLQEEYSWDQERHRQVDLEEERDEKSAGKTVWICTKNDKKLHKQTNNLSKIRIIEFVLTIVKKCWNCLDSVIICKNREKSYQKHIDQRFFQTFEVLIKPNKKWSSPAVITEILYQNWWLCWLLAC